MPVQPRLNPKGRLRDKGVLKSSVPIQLSDFRFSILYRDSDGAIVRPLPRAKRMLSEATCLPHLVQVSIMLLFLSKANVYHGRYCHHHYHNLYRRHHYHLHHYHIH